MSEREHTSKQFEQQLRTLKDKLLLMSHHAEKMIADAMRSLVERRPSVAEDVIKSDDTLDQLEIEIDNLCYQILALEQPVARDLRFGFLQVIAKAAGENRGLKIGIGGANRRQKVAFGPGAFDVGLHEARFVGVVRATELLVEINARSSRSFV